MWPRTKIRSSYGLCRNSNARKACNLMTVALFGKLPAKGDFVSRGMPPELQRIWDRWLSQVFE
ncbi:MAG: TagF domain-containing protein, partial [Pseudomonadota bacterium]